AGLSDLVRRTGVDLRGLSVLILGSGGTSKTAQAVCAALGAREITVVSRRAEKGAVTYEEAYERYAQAEFILNATPVGMYPKQDATPIDIARFPHLRGVVDAIYNPLRTDLVLAARKRGIPAEGGLYMLVAQGIHASEIFFDKEIPAEKADEVFLSVQAEKENIFLIGMPGCGKSTVGRALAKKLGRPFFDTDEAIVQHTGMAISDIFREKGEAAFRDIEEKVIGGIALHTRGAVIATGGGAILREANLHAMRRVGRLYFLDRDIAKIRPTPDRPLSLDREALAARYRERYPLYCAAADVILPPNENISHRVQAIRKDFLYR
ncbi:MAG: AAA family ATPase, partial [Clostridia bacterium]|nr:AAA family ATPase [Clostridia bacterium]